MTLPVTAKRDKELKRKKTIPIFWNQSAKSAILRALHMQGCKCTHWRMTMPSMFYFWIRCLLFHNLISDNQMLQNVLWTSLRVGAGMASKLPAYRFSCHTDYCKKQICQNVHVMFLALLFGVVLFPMHSTCHYYVSLGLLLSHLCPFCVLICLYIVVSVKHYCFRSVTDCFVPQFVIQWCRTVIWPGSNYLFCFLHKFH